MTDWDREDEEESGGRTDMVPPWVLKVGTGLLAVVFIGSIVAGLLARSGSDDRTPSEDSSAEQQRFGRWVESQAQAVVGQSAPGRSRVVAVGFAGDYAPIVGLSAYTTGGAALERMHESSLRILQRLFRESRTAAVTLVWFDPDTLGGEPRTWRQVLAVAMTRDTAEQVDLAATTPGELPDVADRYRFRSRPSARSRRGGHTPLGEPPA